MSVSQQIQRLEKLGLSFDDGKHVGGRAQGKILRKAEPNKVFWGIWKSQKETLKANGISVTKNTDTDSFEVCAWIDVQEKQAEEIKLIQESDLPKLKKSTEKLLLKYQPVHTRRLIYALDKYGSALDGSDTGTGKSFTALAAAIELKKSPFIICSKKAMHGWRKYCEMMGVYPLMIVNWEMLRTGRLPQFLSKEGKGKAMAFHWQVNPKNTLVIFDEVHRAKTRGTLNSKMLLAARRDNLSVLNLSATAGESPLNLGTLGYVLGLFNKPSDHIKWAFNYGVRKGQWGGFTFDGKKENTLKLHEAIYGTGRGSRMRISELGDLFPQNQIISEAYDMENSGAIQKVYEEMRYQLQELRLNMQEDMHKAKAKAKNEGSDSAPEVNRLTVLLRARQKVELLKVPTFIEMAQEFLDEGKSVAVFVNFHETLKAVAEKLETDCVVHGKQSAKESFRSMERFQSDKSRVIVLNIKAGGESISLHDLHGNFPRVSVISPTYSAIELVQALGRIHRAGAKSAALQRIVYAADTIEEEVCERVQAKVQNIRNLNDGDLAEPFQLVKDNE